jgi:hypothetical protein
MLNLKTAARLAKRAAVFKKTIRYSFYFIFVQSKTENFVKTESGMLL